jgi:hypothetical protein
MNAKRNVFIPSTKNFFGGLKVSELKCDSGCNSMLLPISSLTELVNTFPTDRYFYSVTRGNSTAGRTLSLCVSPWDSIALFTIRIADDLLNAQNMQKQSTLRFALCEEDKRHILQNPNLLRLTADSVQILGSTDICMQTRRSHGLLGQSVLANLASIKFRGCELYVNPFCYKLPESFAELAQTVGHIKVQLHQHLPDGFDDWEDDDYGYEDDERVDEYYD